MGELLPDWLTLISICLRRFDKTLAVYFFTVLAGVASPVQAQIIPDDTLGVERSTLRAVMLNGIPSEQIEGGAQRDSLLFHSFQEFNINEGRGAYFLNPDDISTIFSRVTGSNPSNVLGTLGVLGSADLIFLNPNGVLFGPNSQLDIEGSFTTTTANEIVFPNGEVFSAITPEVPSLIENNLIAPIGLVFEGQTLASIVSQGNLSTGQSLTLSAHTISAQGELSAGENLTLQAEDTVQIRDSADKAFVAVSGNELTITGQSQIDIFALNHPQSLVASGGDMTLQSANPVIGDAHYAAGGSFRIEDLTGTLAPLISEVDPIIATANDVELGGYTGASLHILAGGQVRVTGDIEITGVDATATSIGPNAPAPFNEAIFREIVLSDGETTVPIDGSAQPTLDIRAGVDWETVLGGVPGNTNLFAAVNPNPIFGTATTSADINLEGNVRISAPEGLVYLSNQYVPNANLIGGDIQVNDIIVESMVGRGGAVIIDSRSDLTIPGRVSSRASVDDAGDIFLVAQGIVSLLGNAVGDNDITSDTFGPGNGGNISIIADSLLVKDGAQVTSATFDSGQAGDIVVMARDQVSLDGEGGPNAFPSALVSGVGRNSTGNSGTIEVDTTILSLANGGQIFTQTLGDGNAGDVNITANERVIIDGKGTRFPSLIGSDIGVGAIGDSGAVQVITQELTVINGGEVVTTIKGEGNAGDVTIRNAETIFLDGESDIGSLTLANAIGNTGNVVFENVGSLSVNNGARILSSVLKMGLGNSGIVSIDARDIAFLDNASQVFSSIEAGALGNSGGVQINAGSLQINGGAQVSSGNDGQAGISGNVIVVVRDTVALDGVDDNSLPSAITSGLGPNMQNGQAGNIEIITPILTLTNGAAIDSSTFGGGDAGNIVIKAQESVSLDGIGNSVFPFPTLIRSSVAQNAIGNAGDIEVETSSFFVRNGALLLSATGGQGNAGNINIIAQDQVTFDGQAFIPLGQIPPDLLENLLNLYTFAGLELEPTSLTTISSALSVVGPNAIGEAGDISITVIDGSLLLNDGAGLGASTSGRGNGGGITLRAGDTITLSGRGLNGISSLVTSGGNLATQSTGGSINLSAMTVFLENGALLSATNFGQGQAGDINIDDTWVVKLDDHSGILSRSTSGSGGNINFRNVDLLTLRRGSEISTEAGIAPDPENSTRGGGTGGNINADIDFIFAVPSENSDIIANAFDGDGGNIFIVTEGISGLEFRPELTPFSDITASSQFGVDGTVTIDTPGIDFARGFNPLPDAPRGTDITDSCEVSDSRDTVELFDIGQGGSTAGPEAPLSINNFVDANWISLESLTSEITRNLSTAPRLTEMPLEPDITVTSSAPPPRQLITTCQQASQETK